MFVHCEPTDAVQVLKERVQQIVGGDAANIKLKNVAGKDLGESESLAAQGIKNDAEIHMVYKNDGRFRFFFPFYRFIIIIIIIFLPLIAQNKNPPDGSWESVNIASYSSSMEE